MGADGIFTRSIDRENDHGEEVKVESEEKIHEEEGRAGTQEEENSEVGREKDRKEGAEESREKGRSQAQGPGSEGGSGEDTGPSDEAGPGEEAGTAAATYVRARACSVLAPAARFGRRQQHLTFLTGPERSERLRR
jgi:hypothetical protein